MKNIKSQQGYATVLGFVLMVAVALSVFSLNDVGQITNDKMRVQNAADASAYSTAVVVSRDMNFIATTNRAMVANQIAIGQLVGLSSYGHMIEQVAENIDYLAEISNLFPPAAAIIKPITKAIEKSAEILVKVFDTAAKAIIPVNDTIIGILSGLQATFHAAMFASGVQVFNEVAKDNDPSIETSNLVGAYTVGQYMNSYASIMERNSNPKSNPTSDSDRLHLKRYDQFEQVVLESRDPFLTDRRDSFVFGVIEERGGNEFQRKVVNNQYVWEWTSMDTMRVRLLCFPFVDCALAVPLGWGAGHALEDGDYYNYSSGGGIFSSDDRWADSWDHRVAAQFGAFDDGDNHLADIKGLRPFYDLQEDGMRQTGPAMVAVLKKPGSSTRVWKEASKDINGYTLQSSIDVAEDGGIARDQMLGIAKAEPYFARPSDIWARNDGKEEFGNMYNPFWQPRLIETSAIERAAVMGAAAGLDL